MNIAQGVVPNLLSTAIPAANAVKIGQAIMTPNFMVKLYPIAK